MKHCSTHIHMPLMMNYNNYGDPLTFCLVRAPGPELDHNKVWFGQAEFIEEKEHNKKCII